MKQFCNNFVCLFLIDSFDTTYMNLIWNTVTWTNLELQDFSDVSIAKSKVSNYSYCPSCPSELTIAHLWMLKLFNPFLSFFWTSLRNMVAFIFSLCCWDFFWRGFNLVERQAIKSKKSVKVCRNNSAWKNWIKLLLFRNFCKKMSKKRITQKLICGIKITVVILSFS